MDLLKIICLKKFPTSIQDTRGGHFKRDSRAKPHTPPLVYMPNKESANVEWITDRDSINPVFI